MTSHFYLFFPKQCNESAERNSVSVNWVYEDINNDLKLVQGLLKDAAADALNHSVTIVIPGEDVLFLTVKVPGKNLQHIQQAVPYVLEDSVIDDVDNLHFAINKTELSTEHNENITNDYNVAVIDKQYFESIILHLDKAGIHADAMIADYSLLKYGTLLFDGKRALFNKGNLKFTFSIENEVNFEHYGLTENNVDKLIVCNTDTNVDKKIEGFSAKLNLEKEQSSINPLLYLISHKSNERGVNLLQGAYKKKKNWSKTGKTWLPAAALFFVWLSVQGVVFIIDYIQLSKKNKILNTQITQIYKSTFPSSRRTDNAKARMESKLISLKKSKGQSGRSFTEMLSASAAIFSKTKGLKIKSLRYYDGRLNLELNIASLQALDKLKSQLADEQGYQVEIQNASSGKENVTARIQITGADS